VELYLALAGTENSRFCFGFGDASWDEPLGDLIQRRALWLRLLNRLSQFSAGDRALWLRQAEVRLGMEQMKRQFLDNPVTRMPFALMTRAEVRGLLEAGMSVGAHTVSHPVLSKQSAVLAEYEISESRRILEKSLRIPIWSMAYPFGDPASATQREFDLAKRAGYDCAFRNCGGPVTASSSWFALPRIHVTAEMRLSELEAHVSGFHSRMSESVRAM
jgi:peptidoglycan/xylan/chitin deacetylase (PgdA/CDA1 family)